MNNLIVLLLVCCITITTASNSFVSPISGGDPCCNQAKPQTSCTPHPSCGNDKPVEAEEAMPENHCGGEKQDPCDEHHDKLRKSADDINRKLEKDVMTPGMKQMQAQYRRHVLEKQRDAKENDKKRKKLASKLAKQMKAKIALDRVEKQLSKQLEDIHGTQRVLKMQMRMTKNQLKNQNLDVQKIKLPKMNVMKTLKKMHKEQKTDLKDYHKNSQEMVLKGINVAKANFGAEKLNNKIGNRIQKQQIKKAKKLVKSIKKKMKKKF